MRDSPDFAAAGAAEAPPGEVAAPGAFDAAPVAEEDGAAAGVVALGAPEEGALVELDEAVSFLPQPTTRSAAKRETGRTRIFMARTTL